MSDVAAKRLRYVYVFVLLLWPFVFVRCFIRFFVFTTAFACAKSSGRGGAGGMAKRGAKSAASMRVCVAVFVCDCRLPPGCVLSLSPISPCSLSLFGSTHTHFNYMWNACSKFQVHCPKQNQQQQQAHTHTRTRSKHKNKGRSASITDHAPLKA